MNGPDERPPDPPLTYIEVAARGPHDLVVIATLHTDGAQTQSYWLADEVELAQIRAILDREPARQLYAPAEVTIRANTDPAASEGIIVL